MNDLQNEIQELKGFIAELKNDRAAQKDKEMREAWTKYASLSIVGLAVLAAVATQWAGKYSTRTLVNLNDATFNQSKASDAWAFYQAKSIKQNIYEAARDEMAKGGAVTDAATAKTIENINSKITKYEEEKKKPEADAKKFEADRDLARQSAKSTSEHGSGMGMAVSLFQIAIALGSITLVTKKKPLWYLALLTGSIATFEMIRVWLH